MAVIIILNFFSSVQRITYEWIYTFFKKNHPNVGREKIKRGVSDTWICWGNEKIDSIPCFGC